MAGRSRIFVFATLTVFFALILDSGDSVKSSDEFKSSHNKSLLESTFNVLEASHAFTDVAWRVIPTVVSIHSTLVVRTRDLWRQRLGGSDINEFFGDNYYNNHPLPREFRQRGSGSGIIVSKDGHILTNVHVVENAEFIEVTLSDRRTFQAEIVGVDPLTEVAIIKIDADKLPVAELGNSESCRIGEWVLAVGNPLELNSTITAGIISAMGRDINIIRDTYGVENFIQTDAAINPGNSGGALVNLKGEVVGINTAIATENGFNQGYGFAIPINLAKEIMDDLIQKGRVIRGYLGVSMQDINEKKARALGLLSPKGVFIDALSEGGPALLAGLREKDVLIKIDEQEVNNANIVQSIITQKNPGDLLELTVIRKRRPIKLTVSLGERKQSIQVTSVLKQKKNYENGGLRVESINGDVAKDLGIDRDYGVIVTGLERFSPAYEAGIQLHDVILEIGERKVLSVDIFLSELMKFQKSEVVIMKLLRGDTTFHAFMEVMM
ncbi:Do family serine endopeptidase [candidate division KSB1 bacterium]|nr:Do family serine endopeptidase [candidate division KSB1 bacterium]